MSNVLIDENTMTGIANAIRTKKETTDTYLPSEMAEAVLTIDGGGSGMINYSTEEQVIGTWIDGKPLYQKTFFTNQTVYETYTIKIELSETFVVRNIFGGVCKSDGSDMIMFGYYNNEPFEKVRTYAAGNVLVVNNSFISSRPYVTATIQYTKTTD